MLFSTKKTHVLRTSPNSIVYDIKHNRLLERHECKTANRTMANAKITASEGNIREINSENDLFKSLSDISINQPVAGPSYKEYIPSPLTKNTVRVLSSTKITSCDNDEDGQNEEMCAVATDKIKTRRGRSRNRPTNPRIIATNGLIIVYL